MVLTIGWGLHCASAAPSAPLRRVVGCVVVKALVFVCTDAAYASRCTQAKLLEVGWSLAPRVHEVIGGRLVCSG